MLAGLSINSGLPSHRRLRGPNWIMQRPSPLGRSSRRWSARTSATGNSDDEIITLEFDEAVNQTIAYFSLTPPAP